MPDGSDDDAARASDDAPEPSVNDSGEPEEAAADDATESPDSADAAESANAGDDQAADRTADGSDEPDETRGEADSSGRPGGRRIEGPLGPADGDADGAADGESPADAESIDDTPDSEPRSIDDSADSLDEARPPAGADRPDMSAGWSDGAMGEDADADDESSGGELNKVDRSGDEPDDADGESSSADEMSGDSDETDGESDETGDEPEGPKRTDPSDRAPAEASYGSALSDPSEVGGERIEPERAVSEEALPDDEEAAYENPGPGDENRAVTDGAPGEAETPAEAGMAAAGPEAAGGVAGETDDGGLFGGGDGPESDEEMPLTEHIREMLRRLSVVVAIGSVVTFGVLLAGIGITAVPSAEEIIIFLWDHHVNFELYRPHVYGPLEFLLVKLKVAGLAGVIVALPMFVYQTYRFMRPGLYPHERRYYLAAVPTSLILAVVGVAFAHFVVLPAIFQYFIGYTEASAELAFGVRETFNLILLLMGYMAIVFQIPLFIQLAIMMGLVTREWMEQRRLIFWGSFLGLSFVVSPDPTGMAPIIVTATMIALFEGTLALLRWTGN